MNMCQYLEFKLKDNNRNNNNVTISSATQSINYWKINDMINGLIYAPGTVVYEINVPNEKTYTCLGAEKVDIKNELHIQNINQLKTLKYKFYSTNFQIQQGVQAAQIYYKFAK